MSDHPLKRLYPIPASATPEGRERQRLYYEALGRFMHQFAQMESAVALSLWHYARMPHARARAVFSGVRAKDAFSYIQRLMQVSDDISTETQDDMKFLSHHFGEINSTRNDITHFGAEHVAEGTASVTNALKALTGEHVTEFPISETILSDMTADLIKIIMHLRVRHAGIEPPKAIKNQLWIQTVLQQAWSYKRELNHPQKSEKPSRADRGKGKALTGRQKALLRMRPQKAD